MGHFARVENGIVQEVIVAEQDFIDNLVYDKPGEWVQTSYNTHMGVHKLGGTPLRYNFAGKGFLYDSTADAFYAPKPYASWTLNTSTYQWEPPVAYPDADSDERYEWNESTSSWDLIT